jgi:RNA polymerase sigma-70 factor (ECF subfamily)
MLHDQDPLNARDPRDREVFALRHFEQLGRAETVPIPGLSEEARAKQYIQAPKRLNAILAATPGGLEGR